MKKQPLLFYFLVLLLIFLSIGAIYSGLILIVSPDGAKFGLDVDLLKNSEFQDFLVPGIILFLFFGLFPLIIILGLTRKFKSKFFDSLNLLYDYHWSWTFVIYLGFALIIWISVQTLIINQVHFIHTFYILLAILIISVALLPRVRKKYEL